MNPFPPEIVDIHTHKWPSAHAISNLPSYTSAPAASEGRLFSAGIHPWDTAAPLPEELWQRLKATIARPEVVAVGECGLDSRRGATLEIQEQIFLRQAAIASDAGKPIIVHCTGAWHRLLALARKLPGDCPRIIHGFRRNAALARQLLDAGYSLSFGEHFDPEALRVTPAEHRFAETDESSLSIEKIIDLQQLSLREFYNKSIKL